MFANTHVSHGTDPSTFTTEKEGTLINVDAVNEELH